VIKFAIKAQGKGFGPLLVSEVRYDDAKTQCALSARSKNKLLIQYYLETVAVELMADGYADGRHFCHSSHVTLFRHADSVLKMSFASDITAQ
jgi:hypothetical protein